MLKDIVGNNLDYFINIDNIDRMALAEGYDTDRLFLPTVRGKKLAYKRPSDNKLINFGDAKYESYDKHNDKDRRTAYRKRATKIKGDWKKDKFSPNSLALAILWSDKIDL